MKRLDVIMTEQGLVKSREQAQNYIKNGQVYVGGVKAMKPSQQTDEENQIEIKGELDKYVSRGGYKLEAALVEYDINLVGKVCMDVGASTGGFTDCMLQSGAAKVYAIDVGHSQLASKILADNRVINLEHTNIKDIDENDFEKMDFISIDVSFISLTKIMDKVKCLLKDNGEIVVLVKPQFEVGEDRLNRNGIVKDEKARKKAIEAVKKNMTEHGFEIVGVIDSPIKGGDGNSEYLIYGKIKKAKLDNK